MPKPHISIIAPVYGCRTCLWELYFRIEKSIAPLSENWELILVNDASPDGAWETIKEIAQKDLRVKGIDLSRNFGQHYAITAGLDHANGDWVVVMDCDLQDQPEEISKLYNRAQEGFDIVFGIRENRKDSFLKQKFSVIYYKLLNYLSEANINPKIGTFRIMNALVVNSFRKMPEKLRYFGAMINWLGFKSSEVEIEHANRYDGQTSYTFGKMITLGVNGILSFSDKPLRLTIKSGLFLLLSSSTFIIYKIIINLMYSTQSLGWSSLIAAIFFSTGLIVFVLGIIGLYVGKIFEEVKNRPIYLVREILN